MTKRKIVIVGGGFGGLYAAKYLAERLAQNDEWEVVVLSNTSYLLFYPLLIKVATGQVESRHASVFLRGYLDRCRVVLGQFLDYDPQRQQLRFQPHLHDEPQTMTYDHLVLALGSKTVMPDIPGLAQNARTMHSIEDALESRQLFLDRLEMAEGEADPAKRRELLTFTIVGGGYTGCELAIDFYEFLQDAQTLYPHVNADDIHVHLVEMEKQLLPGMPEKLSQATQQHLENRGVQLHLEDSLESVDRQQARLKSGMILPGGGLYWCAGVGPTRATQNLKLPKNKKGFIKTTEYLNVPGDEHVWAIGDCAANPSPGGSVYPPTAQIALKMARHLAKNILRSTVDKPILACRVKSAGMIIPLGKHYAAAQIRSLTMTGIVPWFVWGSYYAWRIPRISNKFKLAFDLIMDEFSGRDVGDPALLVRSRDQRQQAA
jgi:NADH dehydrogenase